ncbi:MAG: ATP-binding protein, partial [Thermodesulfobacteriota bacterium]|nr:ATP-binding protein [Thermodesulfobacteriota bacterium]
GFVRDFKVNLYKKDRTPMDCLLTATLCRSNDGRILELQGIVRDVSESKRLQAQLLQAQKMEAIGILAGGVAHDFNNLLTTVQGYTDLSMMRIDEGDPLYRNLKQIRRASLRAADLTRQLLLFSRKQPMEFTSLNINETVHDMFKMITRLISEDITINKDLQSGSWIIRADQGNIEQVIMNLVVNARDAMPNGGVLTIKTEQVQLDESYLKTYDYARPGRFVCLSISDSGIGMDEETVQHIFEPFFTTKGPGEGSGLGLSVVYGIIKEHQGWINVYSEPGQGSTFRIYLPVTHEKQERETNNIPPLHELQGNKERVLLVEDEAGVREFATRALRENGYIVVEAASASEAINIFEREEKNFHLVFSDVVLHDQSGVQLVEKLLYHNPRLRILLSSGYADDKSKWPIIRERGFPFLQKPYSLYELLGIIKEVIKSNL